MDLNIKSISSAAFILIFFSIMCISTSVSAHEPRVIAGGAINAVVGWRSEPAYEKQMNSFDFIITDAVEVDDPELEVTMLYLKEDAVDAKVISMAKLTGDLRRDRENPNRFNISVLPTKVGAYGFHLKGMVNGAMVDEIFICRGGSKNPDGRSFGCIEELQKFPTGKKSKKHDDDDD